MFEKRKKKKANELEKESNSKLAGSVEMDDDMLASVAGGKAKKVGGFVQCKVCKGTGKSGTGKCPACGGTGQLYDQD